VNCQSRANAGRKFLIVILFLSLLLFSATIVEAALDSGSANPFTDVPKGHWSIKAIDKLVSEGLIEGFPDGTFKGAKVITRYDLALYLARILAKVDEMKAAGASVSPEDTVTISRLTNEYKAELDLLGIKVDQIEKRLLDVELKTEKLDKDLSNIRIEGFYKAEQVFVDEPIDFVGYPYMPYWGDNPNHHYERTGLNQDSGLQNLRQQIYLRFIASPYIGGERKRDIETFVELKGVLSGNNDARLDYRFSDPPIAGDEIDDFATGIIDEKKVSVNQAHMKIHSKRMDIRIFANESITDINDPANLLSGTAFRTWRADWSKAFSFDQGIEFDGAFKKFSYFGSILKDIGLSGDDGNNHEDLTEDFDPTHSYDKDVFSSRLTYDMFKDDSGDSKNNLLIGGTYVETIWDYDEEFQFNKVLGWDVALAHESDHIFELTINPMVSHGRKEDESKGVPIHDTALMVDATYEYKKLLATFKAYRFGRDFQTGPADRPWIDTGINSNFRHKNVIGERLTRTQLKFDLGDSFIQGVDDLTLTALYETKSFEKDPDEPDEDSDGVTGTLAYFQALADLSDKTYVEWKTEHQKDVLAGEQGAWTHDLKVDVKVVEDTSIVGEIGLMDDPDRPDDFGKSFDLNRGKISVNSQINKWLFLNGYIEHYKNKKDHSRNYYNGLDQDSFGGEMTINYKDDLTLKGWADRTEVESTLDPTADGTFDTVVGEFGYNFTRALKMRWVHGFKDSKYVRDDNDFVINDFMEVLYRPTEDTEFRFTYGYDYENPRDGWDNGVLEFWRTEKVYRIAAQTDF